MNNFVKRIWFGALLRPQCWICAAVNHQIVGGAIAVLLFLLTGWFATAGFVALFVFCLWYILSSFRKDLYSADGGQNALYCNLCFRLCQTAQERQQTQTLHHQNYRMPRRRFCETVWPDSEVFGYDDSLCRYGIFWLSLIPLHGPLSATDLKTGVFWDGNSAIMFLPNG